MKKQIERKEVKGLEKMLVTAIDDLGSLANQMRPDSNTTVEPESNVDQDSISAIKESIVVDIVGTQSSEKCNRNGCAGTIDEEESERSCNCHISPPCSYCVDDRHYCPECGWTGRDDQRIKSVYNSTTNQVHLAGVQKVKDLDSNIVDWIVTSIGNSIMTKEGVYPDGTTRSQVEEIVKGSFGGRFHSFGDGRFKYLAYTD